MDYGLLSRFPLLSADARIVQTESFSRGRNSPFTSFPVDSGSLNTSDFEAGRVGQADSFLAGSSLFRRGLEYFTRMGESARQYLADIAREFVSYPNLRPKILLSYEAPARDKDRGNRAFGPAVSSLSL